MQKENPRRPASEIQAELTLWVESHKEDIYNPFLSLQGACPSRQGCLSESLITPQRFRCCTRYPRRNSPYHSIGCCQVSMAWNTHCMDHGSEEGILNAFAEYKYSWSLDPCDTSKLHYAVCKFADRSTVEDIGASQCLPCL